MLLFVPKNLSKTKISLFAWFLLYKKLRPRVVTFCTQILVIFYNFLSESRVTRSCVRAARIYCLDFVYKKQQLYRRYFLYLKACKNPKKIPFLQKFGYKMYRLYRRYFLYPNSCNIKLHVLGTKSNEIICYLLYLHLCKILQKFVYEK